MKRTKNGAESAEQKNIEICAEKKETQPNKKRVGAGKIALRVTACVLCFCLFALLAIEGATRTADKTWEQWVPNYEKEDLTALLDKAPSAMTESDYETIYAQTGLTKIGAEQLLKKGKVSTVKKIQDCYFDNVGYTHDRFAPWTCWEKLKDGKRTVIGDVRAGDIIVTSATQVLGFRYGHAALVVSDGGTILEANTPGTTSHLTSVQVFNDYASFMVLRPNPEKITEETRLAVAEYASSELTEIPYTVFAGIFRKKNQQPLKGTQCAHIVWYAYKQFGFDLDSNGGCIVKPQDLANSEYLEVVQIYGFSPETVWT